MSFSDALNIRPGITAIIGGGGKTSLMYALGEELKHAGSVILCTTTCIFPPHNIPLLIDPTAEDIAAALKQHRLVCVGKMQGEKLGPVNMAVSDLAKLADYVIAEADGSKQMPLKAHAPHEPVIPEGAQVIYVIGADGIGKPIQEAAHRPELYAKALGVDMSHIVTPEDAARLIDHGDTVLFNKAEGEEDVENGRRLAAAFPGRAVIASLKNGQVTEIIG